MRIFGNNKYTDRGGRYNDNRSNKPQMYDAVCDACGRDCKVPFRPSGGKPVYCSNCFEKQGSGSERGRDRGGRREYSNNRSNYRNDSRDRKMFTAICDDCGKECQVPFNPSSDKPIYCSDCFEKRGGNERSGNSKGGNNSKQLEEINEKLDRILGMLEVKKKVKKTVKKEKETPVIA